MIQQSTFGYYFTGKEKVLLNTIEYAEILIFGRKNSTFKIKRGLLFIGCPEF